ncbi:MAG: NAD-dependent epimerase/dehydratase family protein [Firmicutes bacterium]|nr:NAD-dependent epimerase/dehydratase family protein [Bacillota bacterium]
MFYKKVLVTGGGGFIGTNFLLYMVPRHPKTVFINLDKLTGAADLGNLKEVSKRQNYFFVLGDIGSYETVTRIMREGVEAVVNFAAEKYVDKNIDSLNDFIATNVTGCFNLLEAAREFKIKKFLQVSTAGVYGSSGSSDGFTELSPLAPDNPDAAGKAAADCLVRSYNRTYGLNTNIARTVNNYGFFQQREEFVPGVIYHALREQPVTLSGNGRQTRDWLFVEDHCRALELILFKGRRGRVYNISAREEKTDLELAGSILHILGKSSALLNLTAGCPGQNRRCVLEDNCIRLELGWQPQSVLEVALPKTVRWYVQKTPPGSRLKIKK